MARTPANDFVLGVATVKKHWLRSIADVQEICLLGLYKPRLLRALADTLEDVETHLQNNKDKDEKKIS